MSRAGDAARPRSRVLHQLRRDPRTLVLLFVVPPFLITLFRYVFDAQPQTFDRVGPPMVGIFPFIDDVRRHVDRDAARADDAARSSG